MFQRKRRSFSRTTEADATVEQVWDLLRDWRATYWMVTGSVLALPVPDRPAGVGAVTCSWQRWSDASLKAVVNEVVDFEPGRLIAFCERQRPQVDSRLEFHLESRGDRTQVRITFCESMYRYEWGKRGIGATERYLSRLAEGLEIALADKVPGPHEIQTLVLQPSLATVQASYEIEIEAPPDEIWRVNEDEDASLLGHPNLEKQWFVEHDECLLQVQLLRRPDGGLWCAFQQILRPERYRVIVRARSLEVDQRLLPHQNGALLKSTYSWDPNAMSAGAIAAAAQQWLEAVKAAAEGDARPAG